MKVKVYVVDFEIPPRVKKWGLRIGIPAVLLSVAAVALAAPLHSWSTGDTLQATDLNGNFTNLLGEIAALQSEVPPVGAILAWHGSLTGVPALPSGWVECNGQTISNAASPLNNVTLPNLNGDGRFLRGGLTSGVQQGGSVVQQGGDDVVRGLSTVINGDPPNPTTGTIPNMYVGGTLNSQTVASQGVMMRPLNMSVIWIIRIE